KDVGALLGAVAHGIRTTSMTPPERRWCLSVYHTYYLGHRRTEKEKGRGTLQTSALPVGYGAVGGSAFAGTMWRGFANPADASDALGDVVPASPRPVARRLPGHSHRRIAFPPPSASSAGQLI